VFKLLGYIFGREFLDELSEFLFIFRDLYDGFRERHEAVIALFEDTGTTFLVVCAPNEPSVAVAQYFLEEFERREMPSSGVVMNQMHPSTGFTLDPQEILGDLAKGLSDDLKPHTQAQLFARLAANHRRLVGLCSSEKILSKSLFVRMKENQMLWHIPRIEGEVHDLNSLGRAFDEAFLVSSV
jgi:hypothetical protein